MREYEEITSFLGEWGPFQRMVFILLSLSSIPNGYVGMAVVFLADIPLHHCRLPHLNSSGFGLDVNQSVPREVVNGEIILSRCTRFKEQVDSATGFGNETEGCLDGWVFSKERYTSTIVTEWDLVCDNAWKAPFTVTVFFLGVLLGSVFSGIISDRYGRRLIFFATMAVQTIFSLLQAFSNSWEMFCVLYFFVGMGQIANYCAAFILGCELLTKSARVTFAALGACICYAVGYTILPLFAYFIRSWRILLVALSVPGFLYIPLWWYVPESPRWLLSQGRVEEAEAIMRNAAKMNGISPPELILKEEECAEVLENKTVGGQQQYSWLDLVKTANIRNVTVLNMIIWSVVSMSYYGISLNTPNMDGDPYINCLVAACSEFLGYGSIWFFIRYTPRRFTLSFNLLVSGVLLLLVKFIPDELHGLTLTLVMVGKTGITGVFGFLYLYGLEIFPTVVRNMALGATSMASRIGSTVSSYIAYIGTSQKILPYIVIGGATIIIGVLSILLPETKGDELPEFISQVKPIRGMCVKQDSSVGRRRHAQVENRVEKMSVTVSPRSDKLSVREDLCIS